MTYVIEALQRIISQAAFGPTDPVRGTCRIEYSRVVHIHPIT
jgi:hypothetical protein